MVVRGNIRKIPLELRLTEIPYSERDEFHNLDYPGLWDVDVHIVLFFQTETNLLVIAIIVAITGVVSTCVYWYQKKYLPSLSSVTNERLVIGNFHP